MKKTLDLKQLGYLNSIKGKFVVTTILTLLGLALILFSYIASSYVSGNAVNIIKAVDDAHVGLLTLRRHEKDFLARMDLKYSQRFQEKFKQITEHYLPVVMEEKTLEAVTQQLIEEMGAYRDLFLKLVKEFEAIGLDEEKGLRGNLRASIHAVEDEIKRLNDAAAYRDILQLRRNEKDFLIRKDLKYLDKFKANHVILLDTIAGLRAAPDTVKTNLKQLADDYKAKFLALTAAYQRIGLHHNDGLQKEMRTVTHEIEPHFETFDEAVRTTEEKKMKVFTLLVYGAIILLFLIFILLLRFVSRSIIRLVNRMDKHLGELSEGIRAQNGDLTQRIDVEKSDEIGRLMTNYNYMLDVFQGLFRTIKNSTEEIAGVSNEIAAGSSDLAERTNEQAGSVTETSATLEKLSDIIRAGSQSVDDITSDLDAFTTEVEGKSSHIDAVTETMHEIDDSGKKIDNIVTVINDISFQTNLLALNAAVEAARAGEAGRGFAVVAGEVRNLAQKTAESSKTIQEIVTQNVESTQKGMKLVQETAEFFTSIVTNIQDTLNRLKEIAGTIREQTTGIEQINEAMNQLENVISKNAALSEEFSAASLNAKQSTKDLENVVRQFKVDAADDGVSSVKETEAVPVAPPSQPAPRAETPAEESDFFSGGEDDFQEF